MEELYTHEDDMVQYFAQATQSLQNIVSNPIPVKKNWQRSTIYLKTSRNNSLKSTPTRRFFVFRFRWWSWWIIVWVKKDSDFTAYPKMKVIAALTLMKREMASEFDPKLLDSFIRLMGPEAW